MTEAVKALQIKEKQIADDLNEFYFLSSLDDLSTYEEIQEGIESISQIGRELRHIHISLKEEMGDGPYAEMYTNFAEVLAKIRTYQKDGKTKMKTCSKKDGDESPNSSLAQKLLETTLAAKNKVEEEQVDERKEANMRVRKSILVEEEVFRDKLDIEMNQYKKEDVVSVEKYCVRFEQLLDSYFGLLSRAKVAYSDDYDAECKEIFAKTVTKIRNQIKLGKDLVSELNASQKRQLVIDQEKREKRAAETLKKEQMAVALVISQEIEARSTTIIEKCDWLKLDDFDDYKILECSKNQVAIDTECREVLSKFSEFSKIVSVHCGDDDEMVIKTCKTKQNALTARNHYAQKLHDIMSKRDISEEKLKKSSSIPMELSKFNGYDSKLDIYSFRSEFEKLVHQSLQKIYWLDALKNTYLSGPALTLVEKTESIDEAWEKLIAAYGNVKMLLQNKMSSLDKLENLEKVKGHENIAQFLAKLINVMLELGTLAKKHNLECKLYVGGGMEKVLSLLGGNLEMRFLKENLEEISSSSSDWKESEVTQSKRMWDNLVKFLQKELSLRETAVVINKNKLALGLSPKPPPPRDKPGGYPTGQGPVVLRCHICGKDDHVLSTDMGGKKHVDFVSCKLFADWSCKKRKFELLKRKFCLQCISPGIKHSDAHNCSAKYVCPDPSHKSHAKGLHVLLCDDHKAAPGNIALVQQYIKNFIEKRGTFHDFTRNISLTCIYSSMTTVPPLFQNFDKVIPDISERAIFPLQTISVDGVSLRLFYDRGAGDAVLKLAAIKALQKLGRALQIRAGNITMTGVGGIDSITKWGEWSIILPLKSGYDAIISGVCMEKVTAEFPDYDLADVEKDVREKIEDDSLLQQLPKLAQRVGGDTDILLGSKYLRFHPREVWRCDETGLSVADSVFLSVDGTTGVINGPHAKFSEIERKHWLQKGQGHFNLNTFSYYTQSVIDYRAAYERSFYSTLVFGDKCDLSHQSLSEQNLCGNKQRLDLENGCSTLITVRPPKCIETFNAIENVGMSIPFQCPDCRKCETCQNLEIDFINAHVANRSPKCVKTFDEIDTAGTDVSFRCPRCRNCETCKKSQRFDAVSIQEEIEDDVIQRCVTVNIHEGRSSALLPFVTDPDPRIDSQSQEKLALKIFQGQVKGLINKPEERSAAILSESKLQDLGYVDFFDNLSQEIKDHIMSNVRYFLPWRIVFNPNSKSTPCRLVFDASVSPRGQSSLNSLVCKGRNNMNNLVMILIRWVCWLYAFHTDISKMYNTIYLDSKHWRYQLYFWNNELKVGVAPVKKVVISTIYGVRSSGNIAECALRRTAELTKDDYPLAHDVIMNDVYVDDCLSGNHTEKGRSETADQFSLAIAKGGFRDKGLTYSGSHPPEHLANEDGISVNVGGLIWFSKDDVITLKISDNPGKKKRSKKGKLDGKLVRRDCVSAVYGIFDPKGLAAPIVCGFKIDLHDLTVLKLDWDDEIPENLRQIWTSNFEMIQELKSIRYKRAVVPTDAVDLNMETIDFSDASQKMMCIAIYVRFLRKSGEYSSQLLFSRTKIVPADMTLPRAELFAASLNASTGHVIKTALGDRHTKAWKLTDSEVVMHWINSFRSKLKMFVRNLVINVQRLSFLEDWRHVDSGNNLADLGTRKGVKVSEVGPGSEWLEGHHWMRGNASDFPVKSISEINLSHENKCEAQKEQIIVEVLDSSNHVTCLSYCPVVPGVVKGRYAFSKYVIDPNKFRFRKVARVLTWAFLFIKSCLRKTGKLGRLTQICSGPVDCDTSSFFHPDGSYVVTHSEKSKSPLKCKDGLKVEMTTELLKDALRYFFVKATQEVKQFLPLSAYQNISVEKDGILYYTGRILQTQKIGGNLTLCDVSFDLAKSTFCVPIVESHSPLAYSIVNEVHWYDPDVWHAGVESALRTVNSTAYVIGGRRLVKAIKDACTKCRLLWKEEVKVAMGPKDDSNLCIAPAFYNTQIDIVGPFECFSNANKRATLKLWFVVFCCSTTGAIDCKVMEDYTADAFTLAFIRFACRYGYPGNVYPDAGSQLLKGCKDMEISFSDLKHRLSVEYGVEFHPCPVGSHYYHGKVERKIQEIRKSIEKEVGKKRLSLIQWETLGQQISNSINNLPIGLGNKCDSLENLDLLTPNRLLLGRNNNRCPTAPLVLSSDVRKIVQTNQEIFSVWFRSWLISYVPTLVPQPKWFQTNKSISVGDVVLFSKSDKEFENVYQYGMVKLTHISKDGLIRKVDVEYQNPNENSKRVTTRGVRELIVIHPFDELGLSKELYDLAAEAEHDVNVCYC